MADHSRWSGMGRLTRKARPVQETAFQAEARRSTDFGTAVYRRRVELGLDEAQVAEALDIPEDKVEGLETGSTDPDAAILERAARNLGLTIEFNPNLTFRASSPAS